MTNQTTPVCGTVYYSFLLPPVLIPPLFKAKAHVYTLKMTEDGPRVYFSSFHWMS
jgi:hypothetical protein